MKLEKVLSHLNSFEKNSFLKIIMDILGRDVPPQNADQIEAILSEGSGGVKELDNINVARVFELIHEEFREYVLGEFQRNGTQLDVTTDIVIRDGNCIMKQDWFSRLYEREVSSISKRVRDMSASLENGSNSLSQQRIRDYRIYRRCLHTAYTNDDANNMERKVTSDELSILVSLATAMGLSLDEVKLINYTIVPLESKAIDDVISELKEAGVIFYSKKHSTVYVADEVVRVLRRIRGKEVADKHFRRVLRAMREPSINLVCRVHGIDWKSPLEKKIKEIINEGISFTDVLTHDMFRDSVNLNDRKKEFNDLCENKLGISSNIKGKTLEEKATSLVEYFNDLEKDDKLGVTLDGYSALLRDLSQDMPNLNDIVRQEFELQDQDVLQSSLLLDFNIKPRDILELVPSQELKDYCKEKGYKTRGDAVSNLLEVYQDSENLMIENYINIAFRNHSVLKENGINVKDADLGVQFEKLTKRIFELLGLDIDEELRRKVNTKKDKIDILINLGNNEVMIVECKTFKESGYNKFSSVSRQLRSYGDLVRKQGYTIRKSLLIAPDFSDDFVNECELALELDLSLITAESLYSILKGFKESKHDQLPYKLLFRDVLINQERVLKAISR